MKQKNSCNIGICGSCFLNWCYLEFGLINSEKHESFKQQNYVSVKIKQRKFFFSKGRFWVVPEAAP